MTKYKDQIKKIFDKNKKIYSPSFPNEKIVFNAKGINHLIYNGNRSRRERSRIETNIRLLPGAIKLLKIMPLPQEESFYKSEGILYKFWTFEAVINERRIKVIVRQVGRGQKHFWSVIPAWRKDRYGTLNARKRKAED